MREEGGESFSKAVVTDPTVKPKGGAAPVANENRRDATEPGKFFMDNTTQEGVRVTFPKVRRRVEQEPSFPRKGVRSKKLVHELHEKAVVLVFQIPNPKPSRRFWQGRHDPMQ